MKYTFYKHLSEEEISKLAEDIYKGDVFTDKHVRNLDEVMMVFMPLIFVSGDQLEMIKNDPPGMIYEYMENAGHRAINGMPMFWSLNMVSKGDTKKIFERVRKIEEAVKGVK